MKTKKKPKKRRYNIYQRSCSPSKIMAIQCQIIKKAKLNSNKILPFGFVNSSKDKWCKSMHCWYNYGSIEIKELRTPCYIFSPIVDGDVMDSVDIGQVYPPSSGLFVIFWDNTLAICPIQFRFISIYSITGVRYCVT